MAHSILICWSKIRASRLIFVHEVLAHFVFSRNPPTNRQIQKPRARAWFIWKENRLLKRRTGFGMGKNLELEISGWIIISPCTNYNCSDNRSSCNNLGSYFTVNLTSLWIDIQNGLRIWCQCEYQNLSSPSLLSLLPVGSRYTSSWVSDWLIRYETTGTARYTIPSSLFPYFSCQVMECKNWIGMNLFPGVGWTSNSH